MGKGRKLCCRDGEERRRRRQGLEWYRGLFPPFLVSETAFVPVLRLGLTTDLPAMPAAEESEYSGRLYEQHKSAGRKLSASCIPVTTMWTDIQS